MTSDVHTRGMYICLLNDTHEKRRKYFTKNQSIFCHGRKYEFIVILREFQRLSVTLLFKHFRVHHGGVTTLYIFQQFRNQSTLCVAFGSIK